jgi:CRISPR-associated protein Cas1
VKRDDLLDHSGRVSYTVADGSILTASIGGLDDARLRRAQALIAHTEHRLPIARELLEAKLKGQLAVLDSFGLDCGGRVRAAIVLLDRADRIDRVLIAEAQAAEAYWDGWASVPMQFALRDRFPDHWRTFGARRSPLTLAPRNAGNPFSAILNYLSTLLEVETRVALIGRGLDPGLAPFHCDEANRQSLAADVMEPVRAHVDAFVLNLARTRTFSAKDFAETREGACRLGSPARTRPRTEHGRVGEARRPVRRSRGAARGARGQEWSRHGVSDADGRGRSCAG